MNGERFALFTFRPLEMVDLLAVNLIPFVPIGFLDCAAVHHDGRWMDFPELSSARLST